MFSSELTCFDQRLKTSLCLLDPARYHMADVSMRSCRALSQLKYYLRTHSNNGPGVLWGFQPIHVYGLLSTWNPAHEVAERSFCNWSTPFTKSMHLSSMHRPTYIIGRYNVIFSVVRQLNSKPEPSLASMWILLQLSSHIHVLITAVLMIYTNFLPFPFIQQTCKAFLPTLRTAKKARMAWKQRTQGQPANLNLPASS